MPADLLDLPCGPGGRAVAVEAHDADGRGRLVEGPRGATPVLLGEVALPAGPVRVLLDRTERSVGVEVDGRPVARLAGPGLLVDDRAELDLALEGEAGALAWEVPRPGAWARPRTLTVRWRRRAWLLLAHGPVRELLPGGRGTGGPLVRLGPHDDGHALSWSPAATVRDVVLAELLVLGHPPSAFATVR